MDFEDIINDISGLLLALSDSYEIEAERLATSENRDFKNYINSVKKISGE